MYISWPCYVCWTWQQLWRNCGAITWSIDKHSSKEKLPAVVVVYVYWGQYIPRRILLYPVYTGYIPITYWSPMFSSNIYQVCAWYILRRTVYAGVYIAPRYQEQYVGQGGGFLWCLCLEKAVFLAFFEISSRFCGSDKHVLLFLSSWGSLWKSAKSSYGQTSVYMAGICSTQTQGYIPGIYQVYIATPLGI